MVGVGQGYVGVWQRVRRGYGEGTAGYDEGTARYEEDMSGLPRGYGRGYDEAGRGTLGGGTEALRGSEEHHASRSSLIA